MVDMSDITHIDSFKKRKLVAAEVEFYELMTRAAEFEHEGKRSFANEMVSKAKEVRKTIDKLRHSPRKAPVPYLTATNTPMLTVNFEGLFKDNRMDVGYPKTSPEPTPAA